MYYVSIYVQRAKVLHVKKIKMKYEPKMSQKIIIKKYIFRTNTIQSSKK